MKIDENLLTEFVARYPAQPATAFLRAIEIDALARADIPDGLGLDLGCGDGILTEILFNRIGRTPRLVGVDPDPLETDAAKRYSFYEQVLTVGADAIPVADATFDYAISNSVLEHIPDLEPVIRELGRVLKPGGQFFFTVPGPAFRENLSGSVFGTSRERYLAELDRRLAHFNYLSPDDWEELCGRHGLEVSATSGYLGKAATQRWESLSRMTGGLLHSLTFGTRRPIQIQRALKLRAFQNAARFPAPVAKAIASVIATGLGGEDHVDSPGCLLITGRRRLPS